MEKSKSERKKVALSDAIHGALHTMIADRFSQLEGKMLTLIEAMTEDQEVRKSRKDVFRQAIIEQRQIANGDANAVANRVGELLNPSSVKSEEVAVREIHRSKLFDYNDPPDITK